MPECPKDDTCGAAAGNTIADALIRLGPRTVEGDYGRVTMASVTDAIAALEYDRSRCVMKNRSSMRAALRTISGHRLLNHDGPGT